MDAEGKIEELISWIEEKLDRTVNEVKVIARKDTARCPERMLFSIVGEEKNWYMLTWGETRIQNFYIDHSIEMQKKYGRIYETYYFINYPILYEKGKQYKAIYRFFENIKYIYSDYPVKSIKKIYKFSKKEKNNDELIFRIENDFLKRWPEEFHDEIRKMDKFKELDRELRRKSYWNIIIEHGDYAPNNVVSYSDSTKYLLDFEFSVESQPIGYDLLSWFIAKGKKLFYCPYKRYNFIKYELSNQINAFLDEYSKEI